MSKQGSNKETELSILFLIIFGLFFVITGLSEAKEFEAIFFVVLGFTLIVLGVFLILRFKKESQKFENEKNLKILYEFLKKNNKKVTILEFATYSGLPPDKARETIENLAVQVGVSPLIDDEGNIFYKF